MSIAANARSGSASDVTFRMVFGADLHSRKKVAVVRRALISIATGVLAVALLAPTAPPANAASSTVVHGHDYNIGGAFSTQKLVYWSADCSGPEFLAGSTVYALSRRGGSPGSHAIGFGFEEAGSEAGLLAYVDDPTTLTTFNVNVHTGGAGTGHAHAYLRRADGFYIGTLSVSSDLSQWANWQSPDLAGRQFKWRFQYDDGTFADYQRTGTIAQVAADDPDVTYGRVGVLLGCGGDDYYVDNLQVTTATDESQYDFEDLGASVSHLSVWHPKRKVVLRDTRSWRIAYGGRAWLGGDATLRRTGDYFWDTGVLYRKRYGTDRWRAVRPKHRVFTTEGYAWWKMRPDRRTVYEFRSDGNASERSTSRVLVINVRARIRARAEDKRVRSGERIPITGEYRPRTHGVRITLQRKVSGQWRGIATTRTRIGGSFGLRPRAGAAGTYTLRVVSTSGKGNVGNRTGRFVVEVLPKPKPKPPPGCESDCGGTTPPPTTVPTSNPTPPGDVVVLPESRRTVPWIEAPYQSDGSTPSVPLPRTASIPASPV
jgi:hypothetical protein